MGVRFDREGSAWVLGQEGAHSKRRILHASDATGWEISKKLIEKCRADRRITLKEGCFFVDFPKACYVIFEHICLLKQLPRFVRLSPKIRICCQFLNFL
jgi:aspartate oxidase